MVDEITKKHNDGFVGENPDSLADNRKDTLHQPARRRLLKTGVLLVPVILTVRSRPIFASQEGSGIDYDLYNRQREERECRDRERKDRDKDREHE